MADRVVPSWIARTCPASREATGFTTITDHTVNHGGGPLMEIGTSSFDPIAAEPYSATLVAGNHLHQHRRNDDTVKWLHQRKITAAYQIVGFDCGRDRDLMMGRFAFLDFQ